MWHLTLSDVGATYALTWSKLVLGAKSAKWDEFKGLIYYYFLYGTKIARL